jgi:hypothetical protein
VESVLRPYEGISPAAENHVQPTIFAEPAPAPAPPLAPEPNK